jgi:suppressor of G2 allele of SKP1
MNKSFQESGGTVLSTNWNEIGAKETEIQPPTGMEAKKYEM